MPEDPAGWCVIRERWVSDASLGARRRIVLRRLPGGAVHPGDLRCSPGMSRWNTSASSRLETSMTSIAIIGAGTGLGAAVARRFGAEGFTVGLISRHQG